METVAVITDIYGNLRALEAALARVEEIAPKAIYCGGDLVGYGPWPNEVCRLIEERGIPDDLRQLRLRDRPRRRGLRLRLHHSPRPRVGAAFGRLDAGEHRPALQGLHARAALRPPLRVGRQTGAPRPRLPAQGQRVPLRGQACPHLRADRRRSGVRRARLRPHPQALDRHLRRGAVRQLRLGRQAQGRRSARNHCYELEDAR